MFHVVRRVIAALMNRLRPFSPPQDPHAAVREPRRRNPSGRSSAVAVTEPEPMTRVRAVGTSVPRTDDADSCQRNTRLTPAASRTSAY
jgi:hypothetical protein